MTAKTQFLKKLQALQRSPGPFESKSLADIEAFRQKMMLLQENMEEWLKETGVSIDSTSVMLTDLLVDSRAFVMPAVLLRYENRAITFTPLFLYGHGVTGCVEARLVAEGKSTPLYRLFMRSGKNTDWSCAQAGMQSVPERLLDEEVFFGMIERLLP